MEKKTQHKHPQKKEWNGMTVQEGNNKKKKKKTKLKGKGGLMHSRATAAPHGQLAPSLTTPP